MASEPEKLQSLFIEHLNRLHCAKAHLVERLVDIVEQAGFAKVKDIITDTITATEQQILKLDGIYEQLNAQYSFEKCTGLIGFLEDAFLSFHGYFNDPYLSFILMLSYLHHIECVEKASGEILQLLSVKMANASISQILEEVARPADQTLIAELTNLYLVEE